MSKEPESKTQVSFDLLDVLSPEEVAEFTKEAERAGASPTEHFINLTLTKKGQAA